MAVITNADGNNDSQNSQKEEMKQNVDINVQIIFSSMSYMKFCTEQGKELVKASEGGKATELYLQAAQTWPEKTYAYNEGVDEVIFIDCGSDRIEQYLKDGINEKALTKYVSYAIMTLKDMLYRMTVQENKRGNVHCMLLSLHPAQKCMFAMSALLGKVLSYGDIYSAFTVQVCSQPEYRYTFNWISNYGWSLDVIYNAAFNPYEARVETRKSPAQRMDEINSLLGNADTRYGSMTGLDFNGGKPRRDLWEDKGFKWVPDGYDENGKLKYRKQEIPRNKWVDDNGQYWIRYEGRDYKYEELYEEWRKVKHPNDEELEQRIEDAKANQEAAQKRLDKTNDAIMNSVYNSLSDQTQKFIKEETNHIRSIPEYANKSDKEIQAMLAEKGLIPRTNANDYEDNYLFYIDGKYVNSDGLDTIRDAAKKNLEDAKEQVKEAEKAKRLKDDSDWLFYLNAAQVILMVPCAVVAPLALIDIGLNIAVFCVEGDMREANGQEFWDTKSGVITGITIAIDLVSFVPLFFPKPKVKGNLPSPKRDVRTHFNKEGNFEGREIHQPDGTKDIYINDEGAVHHYKVDTEGNVDLLPGEAHFSKKGKFEGEEIHNPDGTKDIYIEDEGTLHHYKVDNDGNVDYIKDGNFEGKGIRKPNETKDIYIDDEGTVRHYQVDSDGNVDYLRESHFNKEGNFEGGEIRNPDGTKDVYINDEGAVHHYKIDNDGNVDHLGETRLNKEGNIEGGEIHNPDGTKDIYINDDGTVHHYKVDNDGNVDHLGETRFNKEGNIEGREIRNPDGTKDIYINDEGAAHHYKVDNDGNVDHLGGDKTPIEELDAQLEDLISMGDGKVTAAAGLENANDAIPAYKASFPQRVAQKIDNMLGRVPEAWHPSAGNIPGADFMEMARTGNFKQVKGWYNLLASVHYYWNSFIFIKDLDSTISERDKNVKEHIGEIGLGIDEQMSKEEIAQHMNEDRIRDEGDYVLDNEQDSQYDNVQDYQYDPVSYAYDTTNKELESMRNGEVEFSNEDFNSVSAMNEAAGKAIAARQNAEAVSTYVDTEQQLNAMIEQNGYDFDDDKFVELIDKNTAAKETIKQNEMQRAADDFMTTEMGMDTLPVDDKNYDDIYDGLLSRNSKDWDVMQGNIDYDQYLQDPEQAKAVAAAQANRAEADFGIEMLIQNDEKVRQARKEEEERKRREEEEQKRNANK